MASNKIKEFPPTAEAIGFSGDGATGGFIPNTPAIAQEVNYSFKNVSVITTALANTLARESNVDLDSTTTSSTLTKITDKLVFDNGSGTSQPSGTQNGQAACVVTNPSTGAKEIKWAGFCWGEAAQGEYYLNSLSSYSLVLNDQGGFGFYDVLINSDPTKNDYNFPIFKVDRTAASDGKATYYGTLVEATSNTKSNSAPNNIVVKVSRKTPGSSQGDDPTVVQAQTYVFSDVVESVYTTTHPTTWNDSIMNDVLRVSDLINKNQAGQPEAVNFRGSGFGLTKLKAKTITIEKNVSAWSSDIYKLLVDLATNAERYVMSVSVMVENAGFAAIWAGGILTYTKSAADGAENVYVTYTNIGELYANTASTSMMASPLRSNNHPKVIIEYIEVQ